MGTLSTLLAICEGNKPADSLIKDQKCEPLMIAVEPTFELPVISGAMSYIWRHCKETKPPITSLGNVPTRKVAKYNPSISITARSSIYELRCISHRTHSMMWELGWLIINNKKHIVKCTESVDILEWIDTDWQNIKSPWWRHQMAPFSALLDICAENSPVIGEFPVQRPVTRSFDVFCDLRLNKRLSK